MVTELLYEGLCNFICTSWMIKAAPTVLFKMINFICILMFSRLLVGQFRFFVVVMFQVQVQETE